MQNELTRVHLLGTEAFIEQLPPFLKEKPVDPEYRKREHSAAQLCVARLCLEELFNDVAGKAPRNKRIHQAVQVHRYTLKEVGDFPGLYSSTISVIANCVHATMKF